MGPVDQTPDRGVYLEGGAGIPASTPRPCRYHLDSRYLIPLLLGTDPVGPRSGEYQDVFDRLEAFVGGPEGRRLGASMIAIGEAFSEIAGDPRSFVPPSEEFSPSARLELLLRQNRLGICWAGHQGRHGGLQFLELARAVHGAVPGVGLADVLIVTSALACPTTTRLLTTDQALIGSPSRRSLGRRHRKGWEVTELP